MTTGSAGQPICDCFPKNHFSPMKMKQQDTVSANDNVVKGTVNNDENAVAVVLPAVNCNNDNHNNNNGDEDAKCHSVWLAINVEPGICRYFEPTLRQVKLVLEHGYTPAEAYNNMLDCDSIMGGALD